MLSDEQKVGLIIGASEKPDGGSILFETLKRSCARNLTMVPTVVVSHLHSTVRDERLTLVGAQRIFLFIKRATSELDMTGMSKMALDHAAEFLVKRFPEARWDEQMTVLEVMET